MIKIKLCPECNETIESILFGKDKYSKDGFYRICKKCRNPLQRIGNKKFYNGHKKEVLEGNKRWRDNNPEKYKESQEKSNAKNPEYKSEYNKKYREKYGERLNANTRKHYRDNKDHIIKQKSEYNRGKMKNDIQFRISKSLRDRTNKAIKGQQKTGSAVKDLGCSIPFLKKYIESLFQPGMTWNNWSNKRGYWELDHIKPLFSFDLTDREQFLKACHYTNLQPIWYEDHKIKSSKEKKE